MTQKTLTYNIKYKKGCFGDRMRRAHLFKPLLEF